jgi:signal transduction histidine kinase
LPEMDGFAVCAEFKASDVLRDIPVIFISAAQDVGDKLKGFKVGGVDYITKPFRAEEVLARIKTHLELAHLREREKDFVLMKERERLARDLHDSVKQTLFMIGATAENLQLNRDLSEDERVDGLDQLRQLSQVALTEMKMMLFELHPAKLVEITLDKLLRQLVESLNGRSSAIITVNVEPLTRLLLPDVQVAFYRVAQEALTNAIRHAKATQITVTLMASNDQIELVIGDDGIGFDAEVIETGGFGLNNMRERAVTLGMKLIINGVPNAGTHIQMIWNDDPLQRKNAYRLG